MNIPVAIAIVQYQGRYLIGQRGTDGPLPGYFEFPGGKCQPGESLIECAVRECAEETGLAVHVIALRREVVHEYPYGSVHLHFFDCELDPTAQAEQLPSRFRWVEPPQLADFQFPQPNEPLIAELIAQ